MCESRRLPRKFVLEMQMIRPWQMGLCRTSLPCVAHTGISCKKICHDETGLVAVGLDGNEWSGAIKGIVPKCAITGNFKTIFCKSWL